jgi:hypothetical protein
MAAAVVSAWRQLAPQAATGRRRVQYRVMPTFQMPASTTSRIFRSPARLQSV